MAGIGSILLNGRNRKYIVKLQESEGDCLNGRNRKDIFSNGRSRKEIV